MFVLYCSVCLSMSVYACVYTGVYTAAWTHVPVLRLEEDTEGPAQSVPVLFINIDLFPVAQMYSLNPNKC